ncbi:hypothetical protein GGH93_002290 [Coemansia aciculifera]|nr:hypothetical protein GGH93_002290 [Coemansia aciculifera]
MAIDGNSGAPSVEDASSYMLQYGRFEAVHKSQLEALGLPAHLWPVLYRKLATDTFDIGSYVAFGDLDSDESSSDNTSSSVAKGLTEHSLCLSVEQLDAGSNVFLVDHAWTTTIDQIIENLDRVPGLLERMEKLTGAYDSLAGSTEMANADSLNPEIEANIPTVTLMTGVSEEKARELLVRVNGCLIDALMAAEDEGKEATPAQNTLQEQILQQLGGGEGFGNSKALQWRTRGYDCAQCALGGGDQLDGMEVSVPLGPGATARDIECTIAPKHLTVSVRGNRVLDGDLHAEVKPDESTWSVENGMLTITLTKRVADSWPELVIGEKHVNPFELRKHLARVGGELWRYFQGYDCMVQGADQSVMKQTNWYIQDEVGLSVAHSSDPNVCCLPFLYLGAQGQVSPFSIIWPVKPISCGDTLTRDFCPSWLKEARQRQGYLQAIFPAPTQPLLDAYLEFTKDLGQTATSATRANLTVTPAPIGQVTRVFVSEATLDVKEAMSAAGFEAVAVIEEADIVFDDDTASAHADKSTNQHPLNSVFSSIDKTVLALQSVAGIQAWLSPGFHLPTQVNEFIGAALMDSNSWWMLASSQGPSNMRPPRVVTNSWAAAVRHMDVGYTSALKCMPSAIALDQVHVAERLVLLTPSNRLYIWHKNMWIYSHQIQLRDNKPEPYQTLAPAVEVAETLFMEQLRAKFGDKVVDSFAAKMDYVITDTVRLLLGIDSSDGKDFGLFSFRFVLGKSADDGIAPLLQGVSPVPVHERLANNTHLVPALLSALSGSPDAEIWKQAGVQQD